MSAKRPAGFIRVAAIAMILAAVVQLGQAILITTRSDDELFEIAKANAKVQRDQEREQMDPRWQFVSEQERPHLMSDSEIDAAASRKAVREQLIEQARQSTESSEAVLVKVAVAGVLLLCAWGAWTGRRRLARVLGGILGTLLAIGALKTYSQLGANEALYRYYQGGPLLPFMDRAMYATSALAAVACLICAMFWRDRPVDPFLDTTS